MTRTRDSYRVSGNTVPELTNALNFLLQRMADRMDKIEGIRGTSSIESNLDMNLNKILEVGEGSDSSDGARVGDLLTEPLTLTELTVLGDTTLQADVEVLDADGHIIHSFGA